MKRSRRLTGFAARPVRDYAAAIDAMHPASLARWLQAVGALAVTWFVYVPIHELMHAYGCILSGGTVTRLEIAPEYGGTLLATLFPFVVSGSSYAGQLTGFDTRGNDAIYLVTVLAPYLLTILIGVPLLQRAAQPLRNEAVRPFVFGASLPIAFSPFISIFGDYYEAGSIVVSRLAHMIDASIPLARWRGDDLFKLIGSPPNGHGTALDWVGVTLSFVLGFVLALLTYHCGARVARRLVRPSSPIPEQTK